MLQKIATYIILALFIVILGAASVFYLYKHKPLEADYKRVMAGLPELEKARVEVKKYREKESQDTAWINPAIDALSKGLSDEIKAGKAEVIAAGKKVVVNIAEQALYMPDSYTFAQDSPQLRTKLIGLLHGKELQGKTFLIGNTTEPVPAQTRGRKKIPGKDARTLAAERSAALITYFEKNNVAPDRLIAASYSSKQPEIGFSLKKHKTVIIIESPLALPEVAAKKETAAAPAPQTAASPTTGPKSSATATAAAPAAPQTAASPTAGPKSSATATAAAPAAPQAQQKTAPAQPKTK